MGKDLKVQTVFLYQSLWHVVQGEASVERHAVRDPPYVARVYIPSFDVLPRPMSQFSSVATWLL